MRSTRKNQAHAQIDDVSGRQALKGQVEDQSSVDTQNVKVDGRRERGRLRRRAMVDAARELFISQGYKATTLEAIIARSGGSREAIYRSFGGKHGLVGAIIADAGERLAFSIGSSNALNLHPRVALKRLALQLVAIWNSPEGRAINKAVVSEGLEAPELIDAWYLRGTKHSICALAGYLKSQVEAGRLVSLDTELVARQFVTLLIGEAAFPFISRSAKADTDLAKTMRCVDLVLRAYEKR